MASALRRSDRSRAQDIKQRLKILTADIPKDIASGCSGTGSLLACFEIPFRIRIRYIAFSHVPFHANRFERCFVAAMEALMTAFLKTDPDEMGDSARVLFFILSFTFVDCASCFSTEARPVFAVEVKPFKQRFVRASLWEESCLFEDGSLQVLSSCRATHTNMRPCGYQDISYISDSENRKCVIHNGICDLPERLFAFGAGFSCTSFSPLNNESSSNTTAVQDDKAGSFGQSGLETCSREMFCQVVASVDTFKGCVEIIGASRPTMFLLENVYQIDAPWF